MANESIKEFVEEIRRQHCAQIEANRTTPVEFNTFRLFGIERREPAFHSKILAELLDPRGSHGQRSLFLDHFLAMLRDRGHLGNTPGDAVGQGYYVETERDKIDLNLYKPDVAYIGIENKINYNRFCLSLYKITTLSFLLQI